MIRGAEGEDAMTVPRTLVEAANAQPAVFIIEAQGGTAASTVRRIPYTEIYRESTILRETPAQRIQRITGSDPN